MKKIVILTATFILFSAHDTLARGFINNPDRFSSIGLSIGYGSIDGNIDLPTTVPLQSAKAKEDTSDVTLDLRIPISHSLTIITAFSFLSNELSTGEDPFELKKNRRLDGFGLRIGARFYFNR